MFRHFIITRFNVRVGKPQNDKNGNHTNTDVWLKNRIDLFEKYCLPSIVGQTSKNFIWLVLFDKKSIQEYMHKIEAYRAVCPQFQPLFFDELSSDELSEKLIAAISSALTDKDEYLITTRLDNDDAIHIEMIEAIQSWFPKENCFLNFPYGYQYDIAQKQTYLLQHCNNNHFISRIESTKEHFYTVIQCEHTKIDQFAKVYNITVNDNLTPVWIETIHDKNILNRVRINAKPVDTSFPFEGFY